MIEHLENEVRDELEASRQGQKRAVAVMHVNGNRIEVLGRIGSGGVIRLGYSYCGVRMERKPCSRWFALSNLAPAGWHRWRSGGSIKPSPSLQRRRRAFSLWPARFLRKWKSGPMDVAAKPARHRSGV